MSHKTKSEAQYGKAKPNGDRCDECRWARRQATRCDIVEPPIEPDGWCKYFHEHEGGVPQWAREAAGATDVMISAARAGKNG